MANREWQVMPAMNPMQQAWGKIRTPAAAYWSQRNQRERRLLGSAAALILLACVYQLLIVPAWSGRIRLQKDLPVLRQQAAELQSLTAKAASLAGQQAERPATPLSKEAVETALKSKGLNPKGVVLSGDMAKVELSAVAFAGLLDWLDDAQKNSQWQVVDANISVPAGANVQPGTVNASITLWQQKHE
ncbi:type II secretion system (T2SS), M family protein [Collimonas arenae]|uniref:Type II secretion system (T2SS), M family protein n=1 Tax=Collimonas arenae TaxID=279058 RepID=A0A127PVZ8_9BURK|nr:type II secretion system protein GspM [Collimonas arenae]AMP01919.1 type II secretion system (T2SS), M family protein [Collimonas arenae]AMP11817.1 type II secretion system (T2SS), M family protein [Collimonas arenae]